MEDAARQKDKFAAIIFLEEWGTMGRKRPTLGLLLDLLMKAELFRAADYLAREILKGKRTIYYTEMYGNNFHKIFFTTFHAM